MTPPRESTTGEALVRALVADQFPHFSTLDVGAFANGWDNDLYRLGSDLLVRMPRREIAVTNLVNEQRWLPVVLSAMRRRPAAGDRALQMTEIVGVGRPGRGYPWPWSIMAWLRGDELAATAHRCAVGAANIVDGYELDGYALALRESSVAALALGDFLAAFHRPAPVDAPRSPYRGITLRERAILTANHIAELRQMPEVVDHLQLDLDAIDARWHELAKVPDWDGPALWLHGDLHPRNLVVDSGHLSGVVDFGDLCAGDPATDLSVAWMLFDNHDREILRGKAGDVSDATWQRAQLWAISLALAHLAGAPEDPVHRFIATTTLGRALSH